MMSIISAPKAFTPIHALSLSVVAATVTICLKWAAWWSTGSVGFLSDAIDSITNLVAALFALAMVVYARRPADERFPYGYGKAEYFSSLIEGILITVGAISILWLSWTHFLRPQPLQAVEFGIALSSITALLNWCVATLLVQVGRKHRSIATEGDGRHLMSHVYMTVGVLLGVGASAATGWTWLDPAVAAFVALNLLRQGIRQTLLSLSGLMDGAFESGDIQRANEGLKALERDGGIFVGLRTRRAGANRFAFVELHAPADWTVDRADKLAHEAERAAERHGIRLMVRIMPAASKP